MGDGLRSRKQRVMASRMPNGMIYMSRDDALDHDIHGEVLRHP